MAAPLYTTISAPHRTISLRRADGTTVRYALARLNSGDVFWRADTFEDSSDHLEPMRWLSHEGRLTVEQVIAAAPACEEVILAWTQAELAPGAAEADWLTADRRVEALERLGDELQAAVATTPQV